ncbi:hypothetical protein N665_0464s0005 [Sinapis alba]|nr:hypothetical protein N665_0464s0005 [Sinapis alba]
MSLAVVTSAIKIRSYFQSHSIEVLTNQPLHTVMQNTNQSVSLSKWAIELSEHDITYKKRTATKSQVLADFLIELSPELEQDLILLTNWILHVDGSSTTKGSGARVQVQSPTGELIRQSFNFGFTASNNKAEYESLIAGLRLAKAVKAKRLSAYCDSHIVPSQFSGEYDTQNERMDAYLTLVQDLAKDFEFFELTKVPRGENRKLLVAPIAATDNEVQDAEQTVEQQDPYWRIEFIDYLADGRLPTKKWAARRLKARSSHYVTINGELHRLTVNKVLLKCIAGDETRLIMAKTHEGAAVGDPPERIDTAASARQWSSRVIEKKNNRRHQEMSRLKERHMADKLDRVLCSHQTTPRVSTKTTPFSLAYGIKAMAPAEVNVTSIRRSKMPQLDSLNRDMLLDALDQLEERRDQALLRIQNYRHQIEGYYNKNVKSRPLSLGDLVLRKVLENTKE